VIKKTKDNRGQGMLFCSFCGKMQSEVRKLVAGPTAYICDECIDLCRCIVEDEEKTVQKSPKNVLPEPQEIKKFLDSYVIIKGFFPTSAMMTEWRFKKVMFC